MGLDSKMHDLRLCLLKRKRPTIPIIDRVVATGAHMLKLLRTLVTLMAILAPVHAAAADQSVFTPIDETHCKVLSQDDETGDVTRRCPGPAGYKLLVIESDDRASITVVTPSGGELPLDFWNIVTPTFSTLGPTIEWRTRTINGKTEVRGLIARVNTFDQSDVTKPQPYSVLVVARIAQGATCVTSVIRTERFNSGEQARSAAADDRRACIHPISKPLNVEKK